MLTSWGGIILTNTLLCADKLPLWTMQLRNTHDLNDQQRSLWQLTQLSASFQNEEISDRFLKANYIQMFIFFSPSSFYTKTFQLHQIKPTTIQHINSSAESENHRTFEPEEAPEFSQFSNSQPWLHI